MSQSTEVVKSGYLTKSPPEAAALVSQWRRRWFVLLDSSRAYPLAERSLRMEYYQSESDTKRLADPKGVVNLKGCSKIVNREPVRGHKFVFDVHTMNRVFHLAADTAIEKHEWVQTLSNLLFTKQDSKPHPTHPQVEPAVDLLSRRVDALDITSQQKAKPKLVRPYLSVDNVLLKPKPERHMARPVSYAPGDFFNGSAMSPTSQQQLDISGKPLSHRPLPGVPGQERKNWPLPPPPDHQPRPASVAVVVMTPDHEEVPKFEENYELAAPSDDNPEPTSPGPYEIARPVNYEDIDLSRTDVACKRDGDIDCNPQPYEEYNGQYESIENNSDDEAGQPYEEYDNNHEQYEEENGPQQYEVPAMTLAAPPPPPPPSSKRTQPLPPLPYSSQHSSISPSPPLPIKKPTDSFPSPPKPLPRKKRNIVKTSSAPPSTSTDNLHGSLPNILESSCEEDALWSTVTSSVGPTIEIETGDYGHISMPRRFSQPECDIKPLRPKPRSPPATSQLQAPVRMKKRYENVGVLFSADPPAGSTPSTRTPTPPMRVENLHQDYSRLRFLN